MANTTSKVRRARKVRYGCHLIQPGELYIEHVEFPGGESGYADSAGRPVRMAECRACAERYGRANLFEAKEKCPWISQTPSPPNPTNSTPTT